jgi:hypothetical protein
MSEEPLPLRVELPTGLIAPRLLAGLPMVAALGIWILWIVILQLFGWRWALGAMMPLTLVWGFLKYHTQKDPAWCDAWLTHVQFAPIYHH